MGAAPGLAKTWDSWPGDGGHRALRWMLTVVGRQTGPGRQSGPSPGRQSPRRAPRWPWFRLLGRPRGAWEGLLPEPKLWLVPLAWALLGFYLMGASGRVGVGPDFPTLPCDSSGNIVTVLLIRLINYFLELLSSAWHLVSEPRGNLGELSDTARKTSGLPSRRFSRPLDPYALGCRLLCAEACFRARLRRPSRGLPGTGPPTLPLPLPSLSPFWRGWDSRGLLGAPPRGALSLGAAGPASLLV